MSDMSSKKSLRPLRWSSLHELEEKFKIPNWVMKPTKKTRRYGFLQRIYMEAERQLTKGNEEFAYALFLHFINIANESHHVDMGKIDRAQNLMIDLKEGLIRRYREKEIQELFNAKTSLQYHFQAIDSVMALTKDTKKTLDEMISLSTEQKSIRNKIPNVDNGLLDDEILNCPVCMEIFQNEIYLCTNGHSICASCSAKLQTCPECRISYAGAYGKVRNRALEKLIQTFREQTESKVSSQISQTGNLKVQMQMREEEMVTINSRLGATNRKLVDSQIIWKRNHLKERTRIETLLGAKSNAAKEKFWMDLWDNVTTTINSYNSS